MDPIFLAMLSPVMATLTLLLAGSLGIPIRPNTTAVSHFKLSDVVWRWIFGVAISVVFVINVNLWVPGKGVYTSLVLIAFLTMLRWLFFFRRGGAEILGCSVVIAAIVAICGALTAYRLDAVSYWLIETSNHDTLYYFEGIRWAALHPLYSDPATVSRELGMGTCTMGAVFIGNDCPVYRSGTYSMLAFAQHFGGVGSANAMLIASAIVGLFLAIGLLPFVAELRARHIGQSHLAPTVLLFVVLAVMVYISPGMLAAAINSNVATMFGASAAAMTLALAIAHEEEAWMLRASTLGLCAAAAAHFYGEAALPATLFAACGVISTSIRKRSVKVFVVGGAICALTFLIATNVVVLELVESASAVNAIATGGAWEGYYLGGNPLAWIAAPFAGMIVNGSPVVTRSMLVIGGMLSVLVAALSIARREFRVGSLGYILFSVLMIGYVELREYAYGEHKIVQLIAPAASMLAVCLVFVLFTQKGRIFSKTQPIAAYVLVGLLVAAIIVHSKNSLVVVEAWKNQHALSLDFARDFPTLKNGEQVLLDDAAAPGVERYQKSHYLAYMTSSQSGHFLLPGLDGDGMRGGYARNISGNSLRNAKDVRWLVQLKSFTNARSPFAYTSDAIRDSTEYQVVDMHRAEPAVAVSGNNWGSCDQNRCTVKAGFEIETLTWGRCANSAELLVSAEVELASAWQKIIIRRDGYSDVVVPLLDNRISIPVRGGWQQLRFFPVGSKGTKEFYVKKVEVKCGS